MKDKEDYGRLKKRIRTLSKGVVGEDVNFEAILSLMKHLTPLEIYDMEKELAGEGIVLEALFPEWEEHLVKMIEIDKK